MTDSPGLSNEGAQRPHLSKQLQTSVKQSIPQDHSEKHLQKVFSLGLNAKQGVAQFAREVPVRTGQPSCEGLSVRGVYYDLIYRYLNHISPLRPDCNPLVVNNEIIY